MKARAKAIPIHEAKANLSKYIQQAKAGKPVYIGAHGETEVVMTAAPKKQPGSVWGAMKGRLWVSDEAWDEATQSVNKDFGRSKIFPDDAAD